MTARIGESWSNPAVYPWLWNGACEAEELPADSPITWRLDAVDDVVSHRNRLYPRTFEVIWHRPMGIPAREGEHPSLAAQRSLEPPVGPEHAEVWVRIEVVMDGHRGPLVTRYEVLSNGGIDGSDYRLPIASMAKAASHMYGKDWEGQAPSLDKVLMRPIEPVGPLVRVTDEARLKRVAVHALEAERLGEPIGEYVGDKVGVSPKTAYGLIGRAREADLLPPSPPGPKRKPIETVIEGSDGGALGAHGGRKGG